MRDLPADSPYRLTEARSLTESIVSLWKRAKASQLQSRGTERSYPPLSQMFADKYE
jgi:hypothetical protein